MAMILKTPTRKRLRMIRTTKKLLEVKGATIGKMKSQIQLCLAPSALPPVAVIDKCLPESSTNKVFPSMRVWHARFMRRPCRTRDT